MKTTKPFWFLFLFLVPIILLLTTCAHFKTQQKYAVPPGLPQPVSEDDARTLYTTAKEYLNAKQYLLAITEFTQFKKKYPNHSLIPYCNYHLAESYLALGEIDQAGTVLCAIQIRDKKTADYFKENGWAEKARPILDRYLAQPLSKHDRAKVELQQGIFAQIVSDLTGARDAFEKAHKLAPKSDAGKKALYYQGLSYLGEQTFSGLSVAREKFNLVTKRYPKDSVAMYSQFYQTVIQYRLREQDNSLTLFQDFVEKYPNTGWTARANYLAGIIAFEKRRDPKTGMEYFDKTIDLLATLNPQGDDPPVSYWQEEVLVPREMLYGSWEFKMKIYMNHYSFDSAVAFGKIMQAAFPETHGIHQLGKLVPLIQLQWQNNCENLVTESDDFLKQYPPAAKRWVNAPATVLYLKGFALDKLSRDTEAIMVYDQLATEYPDSRFADAGLRFMAKCYEDMNDFQTAVSVYDRWITLLPRNTITCYAYIDKAKALAKLERYRDASATLDNFFVRCSNRYDCPKDAIESAKELKTEYQTKLGIAKQPEEDL
jgi:TolA-binding protein